MGENLNNNRVRVIPKGIAWPFALLTFLFFAWAVPNNLTDTMLATFKRIMSFSDSKTAWIQVVCYLFGYGCFAIPGAIFIKKYCYKYGVMLGLGMYALGTFLFWPASKVAVMNNAVGYIMFLFAILILFAGLSILETSTNSYVCAIGPEETATRRLNFSQSFNPFGAITGVVISQIFILSQLNTMTASERAKLSESELAAIQGQELSAVTSTYVILGCVMVAVLIAIALTKMPNLKEGGAVDLKGSFKRLSKNKNYVWGVVAQFFDIGAQIAVWSYVIRYAMQNLHFDDVISSLGPGASTEQIIGALRGVEPVAAGFYNICDAVGLDVLLPRTAEQAGASYVTAGHIYSTACKAGIPPRGEAFLRAVVDAVSLPVYAIGGIGEENIARVAAAGAAGACLMSGFMQSREPAARLQRLRSAAASCLTEA